MEPKIGKIPEGAYMKDGLFVREIPHVVSGRFPGCGLLFQDSMMGEVGRIYWEKVDDKWTVFFEGNLDQSAQALFEQAKYLIDKYLEDR